jgi:2-oxoglutarate dehydrogenase dihydrolipoamide succinyltransferase (E2 component)
MATDVIMPQMGESIAEGTITKWLAKVGDRVERDQPLFEISTDKVDAEIPSPAAGVLLEVKYEEGATVEVNQVVALIGEAGETAAAGSASAPEQGPEPEKAATAASDAAAATKAPAAAPAVTEGVSDEGAEADQPADLEERVRTFSSPVVRKMAAEHGVDISKLGGSGIHGRVTKQDLETHLARRDDTSAAPSASPATARREARPVEVVPSVRREAGGFSVAPYTDGEDVEIEPMSRIRQLTAAHMIYSKATSAHVTTVFHVDMSRVARARARARTGFERQVGTKLTYMPFIFKAVASALKSHRKVNASVDGSNIVYKKNINIGMAVALDWGLLVPVIKGADQLNLIGLAKAANDLADRARSKKLRPEEVQGGTFTITNPGVFGSLFGTPVINQPQVAILGVGAIEKRPVVTADEFGNDVLAIKTMSYFSITYDHRLVDGADADHFMNDLRRNLAEDSWSELDPFI